MDNDLYEDQKVPSGRVTSINFNVLTEADTGKISVLSIEAASEVTDAKLGVPNLSSQCSTCGAKDVKKCEGHFGVIKFPYTILHPYFVREVVQVLNKICPACKAIRKDILVKGAGLTSRNHEPKGCKYCRGDPTVWYPKMRFKLSSNEMFKKTTIMVEVNDKVPKKFQNRSIAAVVPADYWDFIPKDSQQTEHDLTSYRRVLSHAQVHHLLTGVDPGFIKKFISTIDSIFLNSALVTPNCHRLTEVIHPVSTGQTLMFDEHTRDYKKMVDFRGTANELGSRVLDCLKKSKLHTDKSSSKNAVSGLKWVKEVVIGKRTDHSFRMVVVGDPNIKLSEIGIPCHVAERLQIADQINSWNWESLNDCCSLRLLEKGELHVRRKGSLVRVCRMDKLQIGDTIYRPVHDGDIVLVNRPPSIHQHSLIAMTIKILPINSVLSINPLCCSPFRGDFDGDCLHGYIPQSFDSRVELKELVALDRQLVNRQSGRNLLSLSQDSLTAVHLVINDGVLLNLFQMQQLEMFNNHQLQSPAIIKAPSLDTCLWTGRQLFSMLLPPDFNYVFPSNGVHISNGDLVSTSDGSGWLRGTDGNLFHSLVKHSQSSSLDFLYAAQEVLCEWLSMRGLSVSLADLYLSYDSCSRKNMIDEVQCGLRAAEEMCQFKQLMVHSSQNFLAGSVDEDDAMNFEVERMCCERQKSAALCQASVDAFKQVFRDVQHLTYQYASKDNTLMTMFKAGSKGSLLNLVQQGMCLGLQNSLVPLSFKFPHQLSCAGWNTLKAQGSIQQGQDAHEFSESYIPFAIVESSYLTGLNPLECFVHSVVSRESSFSDNAEVPGSLTRKLMFFMRDLYFSYDGTVRNAYGNQLIQFSYNIEKDTSSTSSGMHRNSGENSCVNEVMGGDPVGSMAACAISEAAYSALGHPVSLLEKSPLLNLKNILESGLPKSSSDQTASLFLSKILGRQRHGFEYGALEVKDHLERLFFSDIVSSSVIIFSPQTTSRANVSPWVCHFHISKDIVKRRRLKLHSIIDALNMKCNLSRTEAKINLPNFQIASKDCSTLDTQKNKDTFCITVTFESSKYSQVQIDDVRDFVIPFFLQAVIKGFSEIKKVDILWKDEPRVSKYFSPSSGELYLRVTMSGDSSRKKFWNVLMNNCIQVMDMIDWNRSHPDNIQAMSSAYGIDCAWKLFLKRLKSAASDIGKTILPEHLLLVANCLSSTGEFVGLNARGLARIKERTSVSSPFVQACFSTPADCFIKAAKAGVLDNLQGSLDALVWGKTPSIGTGGQFDIIYSGKGHEISQPLEVYSLLSGQMNSHKMIGKVNLPNAQNQVLGKFDGRPVYAYNASKDMEFISRTLRKFISVNDIMGLSQRLRGILHKCPINYKLSEEEKDILMVALRFHPGRDEKIGTGVQEIKVGYNPQHQNTRCFLLVRTDGTIADFSYHKCVHGALEIIAPLRVKNYEQKWLKSGKE